MLTDDEIDALLETTDDAEFISNDYTKELAIIEDIMNDKVDFWYIQKAMEYITACTRIDDTQEKLNKIIEETYYK